MENLQQKQIKFFNENYNILRVIKLTDDKIFIGSKTNRKCRYCGKKDDVVPFKNKAHTFPELIGNKKLFSFDECDVCNELFSSNIENHFANFLGINRTISQIKGKKKIPTYKNPKDSRIEVKNDGTHVTTYDDDNIFKINEKNKTFEISTIRDPYIPVAVYKCLTKMGLGIIPDDEIKNFQDAIKWIRNKDHKICIANPLMCLYSVTPGVNPFSKITAVLLKRKENIKNVFYLQFILAFNNYCYQIYIPTMLDKDLIGDDIENYSYPIILSDKNTYGESQYYNVDLSCTEIVKNSKLKVVMSYKKKHDLL